MIRRYQKEILYAVVVALAAFTVFCASSGYLGFGRQTKPSVHAWLHSEMKLTAEQEQKLTDIEKSFDEIQKNLQAEIRAANKELASAMLEDKRYSARVTAAVERIHHAQGELQKATLQHIFEMQAALTPEQAEKLNKFAADALIQNP